MISDCERKMGFVTLIKYYTKKTPDLNLEELMYIILQGARVNNAIIIASLWIVVLQQQLVYLFDSPLFVIDIPHVAVHRVRVNPKM